MRWAYNVDGRKEHSRWSPMIKLPSPHTLSLKNWLRPNFNTHPTVTHPWDWILKKRHLSKLLNMMSHRVRDYDDLIGFKFLHIVRSLELFPSLTSTIIGMALYNSLLHLVHHTKLNLFIYIVYRWYHKKVKIDKCQLNNSSFNGKKN